MGVTDSVINLLSAVIAMEYIHRGFEKKRRGWRRYFYFAAGCAAYFFVVTGMNLLLDFEGALSVVYSVVLILYGLAALKGSLYNITFLSLTWTLIALLGTVGVYGAVGIFAEKDFVEWMTAAPHRYLYASLAAAAAKFVLGRIVLRFYIKKEKAEGKADWLILIGLLLFFLTSLLMFRIELVEITTKQRYMSLTALLFIQFIGILFLERMHQESVEYQNQKMKLELHLKFLEETEKNKEENRRNIHRITREIRHWKHDMDGKLSVLYCLMKKGNYREAEEELEKTCAEFLRYPELPQETGNDGLDAALIKAAAECREENIRFSYVILGRPERIDNMAMGSLMWNLFQNSIEACKAVEKDRAVDLLLRESPASTEIHIENSIEGSVLKSNPDLRSGKENREAHGFGMESIFAVVDAYRGSYICFEEEGRFVQEIRLLHFDPQAKEKPCGN